MCGGRVWAFGFGPGSGRRIWGWRGCGILGGGGFVARILCFISRQYRKKGMRGEWLVLVLGRRTLVQYVVVIYFEPVLSGSFGLLVGVFLLRGLGGSVVAMELEVSSSFVWCLYRVR